MKRVSEVQSRFLAGEAQARSLPLGVLWLVSWACLAMGSFWSAPAQACDSYPVLVPPFASTTACGTCHQDAPPTRDNRNQFAVDLYDFCFDCPDGPNACGTCTITEWVDCTLIRTSDSDGDGYSNEEEFSLGTAPGVSGVDECALGLDDCLAESTCEDLQQNTRDTFTCTCPQGFDGDGTSSGSGCIDIDECATGDNDCTEDDSSCQNETGFFSCPCDINFVGSGRAGQGCTFDDPCQNEPCSGLSTCFPANSGIEPFVCRACEQDFVGDITSCDPCPSGYSGDGLGANGCQDVDECLTDNGGCSDGVECINLVGGRRCNGCPLEFSGTGIGPNGCQRDPCADCSEFARCEADSDTPCTCNAGFIGNGVTCTDVNECASDENLVVCGDNSSCRNTVGSFLCPCDAGYALDGRQCVAASCAVFETSCGTRGQCIDSDAQPRCVCGAGYTGTFPDCDAIPGCFPSEASVIGGQGAAGLLSKGRTSAASSPFSTEALLSDLDLDAGREDFGCSVGKQGSSGSSTPLWGLGLLGLLSLLRRRRVALLICGTLSSSACQDQGAAPIQEDSGSGGASAGSGGMENNDAGSGGAGAATGGTGSDSSMGSAGQGGASEGGAGAGGSSQGGAGGSDSEGGAGGSVAEVPAECTDTPGAGGTQMNPTGDGICTHSQECDADSWCNPDGDLCELRLPESGERLTFEDIYPIIEQIGCPQCHYPGGVGDVDPSGSGKNLLMYEFEIAYASLVSAGLSCEGGLKRLCTDDPRSSRFVTKVLKGESDTPESVAFTEWSDESLQKILRWLAGGAKRSSSCGNFIRETGEDCDFGPNPAERCAYGVASCALCTTDCQSADSVPGPRCGDGIVDAAYEICDNGGDTVETVGPNGGFVCGPSCTFIAGAQN